MVVLEPLMKVWDEPLSLLIEFVSAEWPQAPSPVSLPSSAGQKRLRELNAAGRHKRMKAALSCNNKGLLVSTTKPGLIPGSA